MADDIASHSLEELSRHAGEQLDGRALGSDCARVDLRPSSRFSPQALRAAAEMARAIPAVRLDLDLAVAAAIAAQTRRRGLTDETLAAAQRATAAERRVRELELPHLAVPAPLIGEMLAAADARRRELESARRDLAAAREASTRLEGELRGASDEEALRRRAVDEQEAKLEALRTQAARLSETGP